MPLAHGKCGASRGGRRARHVAFVVARTVVHEVWDTIGASVAVAVALPALLPVDGQGRVDPKEGQTWRGKPQPRHSYSYSIQLRGSAMAAGKDDEAIDIPGQERQGL